MVPIKTPGIKLLNDSRDLGGRRVDVEDITINRCGPGRGEIHPGVVPVGADDQDRQGVERPAAMGVVENGGQ